MALKTPIVKIAHIFEKICAILYTYHMRVEVLNGNKSHIPIDAVLHVDKIVDSV